MVSRGSVLWLALALLVAGVPSAASQSLPAIEPGADHTVVAVDVPIAGAAGSGSFQLPVDGGILDVQVDPILLPGPGGTVDVEAYLAEVRLLLPGGATVPLPSMVIRAEDRALDGPAAQALAELAASAEALTVELEALAAEIAAPEEPEPEPEPAEGPDPIAEQLAALQAQAEALAAEAEWVQAFADEAAGAAGAGAAEQAAIAEAMLARAEAGLALVQKGLDSLQAEASAIADEAAGAAPDAPEMPSGSSSASAAPDESASSSSASQAPPSPPVPDPSPKVDAVMGAVAEAQAQADRTAAKAQAARDELAGLAGKVGGKLLAKADELVDEQAAIDGARAAAAMAEQALADRQAGAQAMLAELQAALEEAAADAGQQSQGPRDDADQAALSAQAAIDEALAHLQWAHDWVAEVQAMAGAASEGSLADAARSIASAQRTAESVRGIVERYVASQSPESPDSPIDPPTAEELAGQLAAARQPLEDAVAQAEAAQRDLEAALGDVGSQDPAGGLDAIPLPDLPDGGSPPGAPGSVPMLPPMPGSPASFDQEALAVCVDSLASQACFHYRSPVESSPGSLTVLVALPAGTGALDGAIGSLPGVPGVPGDLPVPDPDEPLPTSSLPLPSLPSLPGLPGPSGSSSASSSGAPSSSGSPSSASASTSSGLLPGSSSSQSSDAPAASPHLQAAADMETLAMRSGEQRAITMTVRNDGSAPDTVRVTAQTDAPVALDMTDGSVTLAPGQAHDFVVRVTPLSAGSGTLDLLATGDQAGTVADTVLVAVQAPPSPPPAASIAASLDPTAVQSAVGQATAVTIRLANEGPAADLVSVSVAGHRMRAEPSQIEVLLQPGEAAAREVWITPMAEGASQVVLSITSDRGADLQPIVTMDAVGALLPVDDDASPQDDDAREDPQDEGGSKGSPGLGLLLTGAAVALALLASRKLRKT